MRVAFAIWLVFLVGLSLSPAEVKMRVHSIGRYHDIGHVAAFAITGVLLIWSGRTFSARITLALFAVGIAFGTELLEQLQYHNPFEWRDAYSDCTGILLALVIVAAARPSPRDPPPQIHGG